MTTLNADTDLSGSQHEVAADSVLGGGAGNDDQASDIRQFVAFFAGEEVFAVELAPVQEIIRVPKVVRVPLAPATLDGLANLRGRVLPIVSLRRMFGFAERPHDDATRALVINIGQPMGIVVDKVASVVGVEPGKIEGVGTIQGTVNVDLLSGIIRDVGGHPMIMVLDIAKLIGQQFAGVSARAGRSAVAGGVTRASADEEQHAVDELQLVSFEVAGQEYAITIDEVQEIVRIPDAIVHVPHSESHVLGIMPLRHRLLPLVSLRRMFNLPLHVDDEQSRIVVVSMGGSASVGIVMDRVNEVLRVPKTQVDAMPGLLVREGALADIAEICRLDGGRRLVSIISARKLLQHSTIQEALTTVDSLSNDEKRMDAASAEDVHDDDEQFVVFRLGLEEFGVPIHSVQEIVRVPEKLTRVPKSPVFVEGVINLRGAVLPVIDLRRRLGMSSVDRSDGQRVMVFLIDGMRTGFIVDLVAEVLKIHKSSIEAVPRLSSGHGKLLARMANLEKQKRLVQLIAPEHLMGEGELADLAALKV